MADSKEDASQSKTIEVERGAERVSFDRQELVRLLAQCLGDLGYGSTASALETESGVPFQEESIAKFRSHILTGDWEAAEADIPSLELPERSVPRIQFLLGEQRYLELLEKGETQRAVEVLRRKLTPLGINSARLHTLTGLIMCKSPKELCEKPEHAPLWEAKWSGTSGAEGENSRAALIRSLEGHIPPSLLIPEHRLLELLGQAREHQLSRRLCCNRRESHFHLLHDENFNRSDVPTREREVLTDHTDEVWFVQFSPCGSYLASASKDATAIIWDVKPSGLTRRHVLYGHTKAISFLAWRPLREGVQSHPELLTCGKDHQIRLWGAEDGRLIETYSFHESDIQAAAWFPDGLRFASTALDKKLHVIEAESSVVLKSWEEDYVIYDLAVGGEDTVVGSCSDHAIRFFHFEDGASDAVSERASITGLTVSADRKQVLVNLCSQDCQEIHLWDIESRSLIGSYVGHQQEKYVIRSGFGGDNEAFIASGSEDQKIYVWHRERGTLLGSLAGHSGMVNSVSWNPKDTSMLASASDDQTIRIWVSELNA